LTAIATSATQIAEHLCTHPGELRAAAESGKAIKEKFDELLSSAEEFSTSSEKLKMTTEETTKAADWISSNFPTGCGCCYNGDGAFADLLQQQNWE
jgi:hypothetical protein